MRQTPSGETTQNQISKAPYLSRCISFEKSVCNASKSSSGLGIRLLEERFASRSPTNSRFIFVSRLRMGRRKNISNRDKVILNVKFHVENTSHQRTVPTANNKIQHPQTTRAYLNSEGHSCRYRRMQQRRKSNR